MLKKVLTEEKLTMAFDEYLSQFPIENGYKNTIQISKENDGRYYVHVCKMRYKMGKWYIDYIIKSERIYDLLNNVICKSAKI